MGSIEDARAGADATTLMALADLNSGGSQQLIPGTQATILCCNCGAPMVWNPAAMCANCIRTRVDITEGIPKSVALQSCRACGRYLNPPKAWAACQPESKELLSICLKRIKGLNKVKLIDASFIWTESHSKRLKVKLTVQKEVFSGVILQQVFVVEMVIHNFQCTNCHMVAAESTWRACVQVRQKVDHKRTFFLLEQLILKHKAHQQTVSVKEVPDGVDFYFLHRHHALKFQDFVTSVVPSRLKSASEKLISEDYNNNKINAKHCFSVEVVPICKDDLILVHPKQFGSMGNLGPLAVCSAVTTSLKLIDPLSMKRGELRSDMFFRHPRAALMTTKQMIEFTVIDSEPTGLSSGKVMQSEVTVARSRDLGSNDEQFRTMCHLGNILQSGDTVMGYDLSAAVYNEADHQKEWPKLQLPDVILVKKVYPEQRRRRRAWKLRALIKEEEDGAYKSMHKTKDEDYEEFMRDVDLDPELRSRLNLYKDPARFKVSEDGAIVPPAAILEQAQEDDVVDDAGEIGLEDMLDDLVLGDEDEEEAVGGGLGGGDEEFSDDDDDAGQGKARRKKGAARNSPY